MEDRQKIPVPRHCFLWSLNETSGEILTHVGPTEFTPSANDRIVRSNGRGGFEQAPMESRAFAVVRDGEYVMLENPLEKAAPDDGPNGNWVPGGNKEKDLHLGTVKIIPGPCAFPLWPGQTAEVRPAHKLGSNHYLLVEVVGEVDEGAYYYQLVRDSAALSSVVIEGEETEDQVAPSEEAVRTPGSLRPGVRIVIQGRHTQRFVPPSGIAVVAQTDELESRQDKNDGVVNLPQAAKEELAKLLTQVREGLTTRQFSVLKNELRHRQDLTSGQRAVMLTSLDDAWYERLSSRRSRSAGDHGPSGVDPYARKAVVLGPKNFCILFDADGNPRIVRGPARVFPGPNDAFMYRGSRRRVYDAYELGENQALWLRLITPIAAGALARQLPPRTALEKERYEPGEQLIVRGLPSVFFPFIAAEVLRPDTGEPHVGNDHHNAIITAVGIDQKSGIYVCDLRTGMVKMIRGETSYLVDPRFEEHVHRRMPADKWNLSIAHAEPQKRTTEDVITPWAISVTIPNNEAVLITSRHGRRVVVGPKTELLEYEELLTPLKLSKGPSKDGAMTVTTGFLRVQGGRVADTFQLESADFVRFKVKLGMAGRFEGVGEECERWFEVEDPVKLLADRVRATIREAARSKVAIELINELPSLVRDVLIPQGNALTFEENGMVIDSIDVLSFEIADKSLADLFTNMQHEAVSLQLKDLRAKHHLESTRFREGVDIEEHDLQRNATKRLVETELHEAQDKHTLQAQKVGHEADIESKRLDQKQAVAQKQWEFSMRTESATAETRAAITLKGAEVEAQAAKLSNDAIVERSEALAEVERKTAQVLAKANAERLKAIQPELVGALHAASDSEVMKAAATNMNLVSLLGGKSPAQLFGQVLRGTPLHRTVDSMKKRSDEDEE